MTIQAGDILDYQGESYEIANNPLQSYFNLQNPAPVFQFTNTANWRGYIATWQITPEGKLFLTGISGTFADGTPVSLESVLGIGRIAISDAIEHHSIPSSNGFTLFLCNIAVQR